MTLTDLNQELSEKYGMKKKLADLYREVKQGFIDQRDRAEMNADCWLAFNCHLGYQQAYLGNSRIFVPIIHDAVEARVTRFSNQVFPTNGRCVDIVTEDGTIPYAHMALLENYIRRSKLRTNILPSLIRNGDCEGQLTVYVSWTEHERTERWRAKEGMKIDGIEDAEVDGIDDVETIKEETIEDGYPSIEVIADNDLLILPATADGVDDALDNGGSVTIAMRLSKGEVQRYIDRGIFPEDKGKLVLDGFTSGTSQQKDTQKALAEEAGIKVNQGGQYALIYQTWKKFKIGKEERLCVSYFAAADNVLSSKRNPYWCDKCPIISTPVKKLAGVARGIAPVAPTLKLQYAANDAVNEGMDSAMYSLLPIVMTDPEKNPRVGSMVMNLAAIWMTSPQDTEFVEFPQLWHEAFNIVATCQGMIFQSLGVNGAMVLQNSGKRMTQAEISNEQQIDIMSTADYVTMLEEGILTPILERFYDYDRQFRTTPTTVRAYGELGLQARMEVAEPIQDNHRWTFRWFGVEQARSAQRIQQQIAAMNVLRGIPPQLYPGRQMDIVPIIENLVLNAFGPSTAPLIFKDQRSQLSVDPETENQLLNMGYEAHVHPLDNDQEHLQSHMTDLQQNGDTSGFLRIHILAHQAQLAAKQNQQHQIEQGGMPGVPGGAGQPGVAGTPRPGSVPEGPISKGPNGMIHKDQLRDPSMMPRK